MRALIPTLALALLAAPAFAQAPAPAAPVAPGPVAPAPMAPPPAAAPEAMPAPPQARPRPQRPRMTFAQRFDAANTTHDGKLTLEQARAARLAVVVRNFSAIDRDNKGYVTRRDMVAYNKARRAQRTAPPAPVQQQ